MRKILSIIAAILIIPSLALAAGQCKKLTDDQYRAQLISRPIVIDLTESGIDGTWTWNFNKNGALIEQIKFKSPVPAYKGNIIVDITATWQVTNAILHTHITDVKHNDTQNRNLNRQLDEMTYGLKQAPDMEINLNDCESNDIQSIKAQQNLKAAASALMK